MHEVISILIIDGYRFLECSGSDPLKTSTSVSPCVPHSLLIFYNSLSYISFIVVLQGPSLFCQ